MKVRDIIKNIETQHEVNKVTAKGLHVWLNVKNHVIARIARGAYDNINLSKKNLTSLFFAAFKGFFLWFKHFDYWFISASNLRREIDGEHHNILMEYPAGLLKKSLFIELPFYKHYPKSKIPSKHLASKAFLFILETIYTKLFLRKINIENRVTIQRILDEHKLDISIESLAKKMVAQYAVMCFILKFKSPKVVFLNTSYTNYGYIKAFKEKGIKVVEFQHGVINPEHYGYNLFQSFDDLYFPDYLLTFGNSEKTVFKEHNLWGSSCEIVPIGHFYTEYINLHYNEDNKLSALKEKYKLTLAVSLQDCHIGVQLVPMLIEVAKKHADCLFILKPRRTPEADYKAQYDFPENIVFMEGLNVYEAISSANVHVSAYSSCALEAPALGVKNCLFNIENKAVSYYENILASSTTTYVDNIEEFSSFIEQFKQEEKEVNKANNAEVIVPRYFENIQHFLQKITDYNQ